MSSKDKVTEDAIDASDTKAFGENKIAKDKSADGATGSHINFHGGDKIHSTFTHHLFLGPAHNKMSSE